MSLRRFEFETPALCRPSYSSSLSLFQHESSDEMFLATLPQEMRGKERSRDLHLQQEGGVGGQNERERESEREEILERKSECSRKSERGRGLRIKKN